MPLGRVASNQSSILGIYTTFITINISFILYNIHEFASLLVFVSSVRILTSRAHDQMWTRLRRDSSPEYLGMQRISDIASVEYNCIMPLDFRVMAVDVN